MTPRPVALGFTDGLAAIDELRQRVMAGHHDYAIMLAGGLALSRKTITREVRGDKGGWVWAIRNHIDDSTQHLSDSELWSESNIGEALDKWALLDMSGDPMLDLPGRGPVLGSTLTVEASITAAEWREQHAKERAAEPLVFRLSEAPGALRMGEDEWEPADPALVLEPCDIGPATVASIDLEATGMAFNDGHTVMFAATSIELTIEDIDDLIATLTAIKEDAIANRGFAIRASGYWTNGIEED
jgi:hypothetical protein